MKIDVVSGDDLTKRKHIQEEEHRPKDRVLWHSWSERGCCRREILERSRKGLVWKIWCEPFECCAITFSAVLVVGLFRAVRMSFCPFNSADSVPCLALNPDWNLSATACSWRWNWTETVIGDESWLIRSLCFLYCPLMGGKIVPKNLQWHCSLSFLHLHSSCLHWHLKLWLYHWAKGKHSGKTWEYL